MPEKPAMPSAEKHTQANVELSVDKQKYLTDLSNMLNEVYEKYPASEKGSAYARDEEEQNKDKRQARAYGYIDGYMRMLQETGIIKKHELLAIITEAKERAKRSAA